jgi:NAD(P)H-hydrate epimerase
MIKVTPVLLSTEIREIEQHMATHQAIPTILLMESAGLQSALFINKHYPTGQICIVLGKGGNAGDGLATARHLFAMGRVPNLVFTAKQSEINGDAKTMLEATKHLPLTSGSKYLEKAVVIVDAIYGTGLNRELSKSDLEFIHAINNSKADIVSLDIPSGLNADSMTCMSPFVQATHILAFGFYKLCHFQMNPTSPSNSILHLLPIGQIHESCHQTSKIEFIENFTLPPRIETGHKNSFGHVLIIGGSPGLIGAPILAGIAALRSGAGLVTVMVPSASLASAKPEFPPEIMLTSPEGSGLEFEEKDAPNIIEFIKKRKISCIAIGMGIGESKKTEKFIKEIIEKTSIPLVIDAEALSIFKNWTMQPDRLLMAMPHPGEFTKHFNQENLPVTLDLIKTKARTLGIQIAYKSATPLVTNGSHSYLTRNSFSALAKAGSGDVLAGITASFVAQGFNQLSLPAAVWVHHKIGCHLSNSKQSYSATASDIAQACRQVVMQLT